MKNVVSISLGQEEFDCDFRTNFLGRRFHVTRRGTNRDRRAAAQLVREAADQADVIGLGMVADHYSVGTNYFRQPDTHKLEQQAGAKTPKKAKGAQPVEATNLEADLAAESRCPRLHSQ